MRVDGREVAVAGNLLQPLTRRTNDILRLVVAALVLAAVITSSLITRNDWVALEKSISDIVGILTPTQSNLVYLVYGIAILVLPFAILIGLIVGRQWKLLGAYAAAGLIAVLALSISEQRHRGAAMAFRSVRPAQYRAVAVPRRPAVDRDARRSPHGVGSLAALTLAAVVVDAAPRVRAHPPLRQRRSFPPGRCSDWPLAGSSAP